MENRPKTIIIDLDGTLVHHWGSLSQQFQKTALLLNGVKEVFDEWDRKGYRIIILTGRKESMRKLTEEQLQNCGIFYDQLIMGVGGGARVLINDLKPNSEQETAISINVNRNEGLKHLKGI